MCYDCKMLPFGEYVVDELDNKSLSLESVKNVFTRKILTKPDILHIVTHADSLNLTFPCKSMSTGDVIGVPCAFPFTICG